MKPVSLGRSQQMAVWHWFGACSLSVLLWHCFLDVSRFVCVPVLAVARGLGIWCHLYLLPPPPEREREVALHPCPKSSNQTPLIGRLRHLQVNSFMARGMGVLSVTLYCLPLGLFNPREGKVINFILVSPPFLPDAHNCSCLPVY